MLRKILLLVCIAFVVVCYGYPCLILPLGSYTYEYELEGEKEEISLQFNFNGTFLAEGSEDVGYYKLKGNKIILSEDETFDEADLQVKINNIYELNVPLMGTFKNSIALYATMGVGVLAVLLVLTIPSKRD